MDPIYEFKDEQPSMKYMLIVVGLGMLAMALFAPFPHDAPPLMVWGLKAMLLFFAVLTVVLAPGVRLRAYPEYIDVRYGITPWIGFRLDHDKIVSIRAVEYSPMKDFGGWGIKGGFGEWKGWTAWTASITNKALAIETTGKKYLIGCPNPGEAEVMLNNLVGAK
jgi:hypothetical protein